MADKMINDKIIQKQVKNRRFKLGTTSFIVPDHIITNVEKLGPFIDEVELLVFESSPDEVVPSKHDIKRLYDLSIEHHLTYNVHLPTDVSLTGSCLQDRQRACGALLRVIERFSPLTPCTHTLHLDMPKKIINAIDYCDDINHCDELKKWQTNTRKGLELFLPHLPDTGIISIETLNYPFCYVEPFIEEFKFQVCIDAGHQIKYGYNLKETFNRHQQRTPLIHLHGVDFSGPYIKDHTALSKTPKKVLNEIFSILERFEGVVSLEVFNLENLNGSLAVLSQWFDKITAPVQIDQRNSEV